MNQVNIGSDNGLSLFQCKAIISTIARILSIGPLEVKFSDILVKNWTFFIQENAFDIANPWNGEMS